MNKRLLSLATLLLLISSITFAAPPKYTAKSDEILGSYKWIKSLEARYSPYGEGEDEQVEATFLDYGKFEIKINTDGKLTATIFDYNFEVKSRDGKLEFGDSDINECDDPGCGYITELDGEILVEKYRGKYVPILMITTTMSFYFPEEEDAYYGEVTSKEKFRFDKQIINAKPLYTNMEMDSRFNKIYKSCNKVHKYAMGLTCATATRVKFNSKVDVSSDGFLTYFSQASLLKKLSKTAFNSSIIALNRAMLNIYTQVGKEGITSKKKENIANYKEYLKQISQYVTGNKFNTIYIEKNLYTGFSNSYSRRQVLIVINSKYRTVTKFHFNSL